MTAFLSGVAVALVMDQSAQLAGYVPEAGTSLGSFVELLLNVDEFVWASVLVGSIALLIMALLRQTRVAGAASLVALVVPTIAVYLWEPGNVELVEDVSEIPSGFPPFSLPDITLLGYELVLSAIVVAVVIAVQGAGVSQSVRNPDGSLGDTSQDMFAQGVGNTAASFFSGMPTGASVSQSALNAEVGARSRYAMLFHGVGMLVIILLAANLVGNVPMTVLAAIMIVAGFSAIKFDDLRSTWRVRGSGRWAMVITFLATLVTSIPVAIGIGIVVSLVLFIIRAAETVRVHRLVPGEDGEIRMTEPPKELSSDEVVALEAFGPLYFAAARTVHDQFPARGSAENFAVVLLVRGASQIGVTFFEEIHEYTRDFAEHRGRFYLVGISPHTEEKVHRSDLLPIADEVVVLVPATEVLGEAFDEAVRQAERWIGNDDDGDAEDDDESEADDGAEEVGVLRRLWRRVWRRLSGMLRAGPGRTGRRGRPAGPGRGSRSS